MRMLSALLASLAAVLLGSAFTAALGWADQSDRERPARDRPAKSEKQRGKSDEDDSQSRGEEVRAEPEHPLGAPPGLVKEPGDPAAPGLPEPPALGKTVGVRPDPEQGTVRIKSPGSARWVRLTEAETLPVGATIDASDGLVEVVAEVDPATGERQNAVLYGSQFKVDQLQRPGEPAPVVDLVLKGGDFSDCRAATPVARAAGAGEGGRAGIVRGLWASAKGRFRTRGRHSSATVRGTRWATVDRCSSTTVKVFEGVVDVMDFGLGRVFPVRAGQRHVARRHGH